MRLKDGQTLAADLVVMAVGIRPNTALAKEAGIEVEARHRGRRHAC